MFLFSEATFIFDLISSVYFGMELFTRFICCIDKYQFIVDSFNIVDLLDLIIFLIYALTRVLTIQQHGPGRHFLISVMHKSWIGNMSISYKQ